MENNKLGTFIEKTYSWGKKLILLETSQIVPCTSEEKRIYGVDVKLKEEHSIFEIAIFPFEDGGVYYKANIKEFGYEPVYFKDLDKCKEFLIKEAQKRKVLKLN